MEEFGARHEALLETKKPNIPEKRLVEIKQKRINEGEAYQSLIEHFGWKRLVEDWIKPRIGVDQFLTCKEEDMKKVRDQMLILKEMLEFIYGKIQGKRINQQFLDLIRKIKREEENK